LGPGPTDRAAFERALVEPSSSAQRAAEVADSLTMFEAAGFSEVVRPTIRRVVMRVDFS
jgi:hypothetical protein